MDETLNNFLTEEELMKLTGLKKQQLSVLRSQSKLPFCRINQNNRLYREKSIVDWLIENETVLNKGEIH